MSRYGPALAAALAAVVVFVGLVPYSGNDTDPPECFALLGYVVPCGLGADQEQGAGLALAGAVVAAVLVCVGWAVGRSQAATARLVRLREERPAPAARDEP